MKKLNRIERFVSLLLHAAFIATHVWLAVFFWPNPWATAFFAVLAFSSAVVRLRVAWLSAGLWFRQVIPGAEDVKL